MDRPLRILMVCTANQCRSPMAAALLARRLPKADVRSAGSLPGGQAASGGSVRAMAARHLDISEHRSTKLERGLVAGADLVIAMARAHVRDAVVLEPSALHKTFTLRELVRRGEQVGPAIELDRWLAVVGGGRQPSDLLGDDPADDIDDPIGMPDKAYEETAVILDDLVERLGRLLEPLTTWGS